MSSLSSNTQKKKVEKRGNKWCVVHCHGEDAGKIIKCFSTKPEADKMHRAIQANKKTSIERRRDRIAKRMFGKPFNQLTDAQKEKVHKAAGGKPNKPGQGNPAHKPWKKSDNMESKPRDARPPADWWDKCTSKARKFAKDADKFCGALWHNPAQFPGGTGMRSAFGKTFTFTTDKLEIKETDGKEYIIGYASTGDLDLVNDIVTGDCLHDMADQVKNRSIKIDVEHDSYDGDTHWTKEKAKTIIPAARIIDAAVDQKGLLIKAEINKDYKKFDADGNVVFDYTQLKENIQNGFLDAWSIAYIPLKTTTKTTDEGRVRLLQKLSLLNVAFTGNPANPEASFSAVMLKSLNYLNEEDNMTEEELKRLEDLEERIKALEDKEEDELDETEEDAETEEAEEAEDADEEEATEETESEEKEDEEEDEDKPSEVEEVKSRVEKLEKALKKPEYKGTQEGMKEELSKKALKDAPKKSPLDVIA